MADHATTPYLLVPGTWQEPSDYAAFHGFMRQQGFAHLGADRPFAWSGDIGGMKLFRRHSDWQAGGNAFYAYLCPPVFNWEYSAGRWIDNHGQRPGYVPIADRRVVAHSHGGNVVAYACAAGLKVSLLVTVGTPVRRDMAAVWEQARPNIGYWLHLFESSYKANLMQLLGSLFDGRLGVVWRHPLADCNIDVPGIGHSGVLTRPELFRLWHEHGWLAMMKEGV